MFFLHDTASVMQSLNFMRAGTKYSQSFEMKIGNWSHIMIHTVLKKKCSFIIEPIMAFVTLN